MERRSTNRRKKERSKEKKRDGTRHGGGQTGREVGGRQGGGRAGREGGARTTPHTQKLSIRSCEVALHGRLPTKTWRPLIDSPFGPITCVGWAGLLKVVRRLKRRGPVLLLDTRQEAPLVSERQLSAPYSRDRERR